MDEARRERLKESLLILEPLTPPQQRAWIAERLSDDPELAAEAERLLAVTVGEALTPLVAAPASLSAAGVLPARIGPYVVEGLIAQGGMGSVYRAHQYVPIRRRAAVKVLRAELISRQLFERFEDERQAIARMEHRNVARLLDTGTAEDGRAYIAMELVDGPPITEYAALHRLSLERRLDLFVQVCRGVQHAHNRGILHRDLKPSNILVADEDAQPVPKVIDFGVAKLVAADATRSGHTLSGQLLGTLGYMSPEQADRVQPDADVRSDVYALGAILHELLTGELPVPVEQLKGQTVGELSEAIRRFPRLPPSRRGGREAGRGVAESIPADLDCLVLKASHPDPEQRYASASELAADIERFLSGRPIAARPPSAWYEARKFVRRHRLPVLSGVVVLAALVAGMLAAGLGFRRALLDRRAAEAALLQAQEEKARADDALARAEEVAGYLRELLMRAHPARLGPRATFDQILKAAAADVLADPPANVLVRAEVASALAEPLYLTGDYEGVEKLLLPQVEGLASQALPQARALRARIMLRLGYVASRQSRPQEAEERFIKAAEFAKFSGSPQLEFQTTGALAQTYSAGGKYDQAIEMLHAMLESPTGKSDELLRASALSNLGVAYGRKGAAAKGLPFSREGFEIRSRLAPRDPNTHNMGWQLGISYMENGQLEDSVRILEQTYAASREASGSDHADVVAGVVLLHYAKARRGDGPSVIPPMREAIARQRALGTPLPQLAQSRMYLAGALMLVGDREAALAEADATLEELTGATSDCDRAVVTVLLQVGTMFSAHNAPRESLAYLERAFECTKSQPAVAPLGVRIAGAIVWSYRRMGDSEGEQRWRVIEAALREPRRP
jgi:tetratricopeptide (TPR) repeat protein/tRNA A-37 threonylcarbamoyl transferase component Bud32